MKPLLPNKKALSEIVSYTLLIVIAIAISILVFSYIKFIIPKYQTPECPEQVYLSINEPACSLSQKTLNFSITNRGNFNIDGFYVRLREDGRSVKNSFEHLENQFFDSGGIKPGTKEFFSYSKISLNSLQSDYNLEIQPTLFNSNNELITCTDGIIKVKVVCI